MLTLAGLGWLPTTLDDGQTPPEAGLITVRTMAAPAAVPTVKAQSAALPTLPAPPELPDAVAAPPDAFMGDWRASDGQRLSVNTGGHGHYRVAVGGEVYDGVLKDGRVHFALGIDGEWLQAVGKAPCLYLGSGKRYCHVQ